MIRRVKIGRSVYLVDDKEKTYQFLKRNPRWNRMSRMLNHFNRRSINGYTRIFRNGQRKVLQYN